MKKLVQNPKVIKKIEEIERQGIWQDRHDWVKEIKAKEPAQPTKKANKNLLLKYF